MNKDELLKQYEDMKKKIQELTSKHKATSLYIQNIEDKISDVKRKIKSLDISIGQNKSIFPKSNEIEKEIAALLKKVVYPYIFSYNTNLSELEYIKVLNEINRLRNLSNEADHFEEYKDINEEVEYLKRQLEEILQPTLKQKQEELKRIKVLRNEMYRVRDTEILVNKEVISIETLSENVYLVEVLVKTFIHKDDKVETNLITYQLRDSKWFKFNKKMTSNKEIIDRKEIDRLFNLYNKFINK